MNILDTFRLTDDQRRAVSETTDLAVSAGAGSGKTNTLTARYLRLLDQNAAPRRVVAITFTEKATREMRNRIRSRIHHWIEHECPPDAQPRWRGIQSEIEAARIGTIHSLCAEILRAHPAEARIDPRFGVLDEGFAAALQAQVVQDSLAWATGQPDLAPLFDALTPSVLESILSTLLKQRLQAEIAFTATVSAQTALTAALRSFLDLPIVRASWTTLRALNDDGALLADAGDKLAAQVQQLLTQCDLAERALYKNRPSDAALALYTIRRDHLKKGAGKKTSAAKAAIGELQAAYDEQLDPWLGGKSSTDEPPDPALDARVGAIAELLRVLFQHAQDEYQKIKTTRGELDFDDMERGAQQLLRDPKIRAHWQAQLDTLLVDEFQDTNDRQREIIEALAGGDTLTPGYGSVNERVNVSKGEGRLFIVGDPKQSIYRFRGADVTVFSRVREDIKTRGGLPIDLSETFRAHADLIEPLNEMLARIMGATAPRAYYTPFARLKSSRTEPTVIRAPYIELLLGMGDDPRRTAAQLLAARLAELHDTENLAWDQMVCLFRASTGFDDYEQAFSAANIPFVTVAGRGFYDRPEIRDLLNLLRALADPSDDLAMAGLLRSPAFGLTDAALYQLRFTAAKTPRPYRDALDADLSTLSETDRARAESARAVLAKCTALVGRVSVAELLKTILHETNYLALLALVTGERLRRNVEKLLSDAYDSGLTNVNDFIEYIETVSDAGAREGEAPSEAEGAVRLMTVHKAKGLQFPVVVLADAARARPNINTPVLLSPELGVVPRLTSDDGLSALFALAKGYEQDRSTAEDLRLLYVAATRAQEKLIVCAHQPKRAGRTDVWFHQMSAAAALSPDDIAAEPEAWHECTLPDSAHKIAYLAAAQPRVPAAPKPAAAQPTEKIANALFAPLHEPHTIETDENELTLADQLADDNAGIQIGKLVHAALRQWTFPGDTAYDALIRAAVANYTLPAPDLLPRVRTLLERLRRDPRFAEINTAPHRRTELPFTFTTGEFITNGAMDLFYRTAAGAWHIIDFKTESLTRAELPRVLSKYHAQLLRYLAAAHQINLTPQAWLCFLDCEGGVSWQEIK